MFTRLLLLLGCASVGLTASPSDTAYVFPSVGGGDGELTFPFAVSLPLGTSPMTHIQLRDEGDASSRTLYTIDETGLGESFTVASTFGQPSVVRVGDRVVARGCCPLWMARWDVSGSTVVLEEAVFFGFTGWDETTNPVANYREDIDAGVWEITFRTGMFDAAQNEQQVTVRYSAADGLPISAVGSYPLPGYHVSATNAFLDWQPELTRPWNLATRPDGTPLPLAFGRTLSPLQSENLRATLIIVNPDGTLSAAVATETMLEIVEVYPAAEGSFAWHVRNQAGDDYLLITNDDLTEIEGYQIDYPGSSRSAGDTIAAIPGTNSYVYLTTQADEPGLLLQPIGSPVAAAAADVRALPEELFAWVPYTPIFESPVTIERTAVDLSQYPGIPDQITISPYAGVTLQAETLGAVAVAGPSATAFEGEQPQVIPSFTEGDTPSFRMTWDTVEDAIYLIDADVYLAPEAGVAIDDFLFGTGAPVSVDVSSEPAKRYFDVKRAD
jgi:hypothetical protein